MITGALIPMDFSSIKTTGLQIKIYGRPQMYRPHWCQYHQKYVMAS